MSEPGDRARAPHLRLGAGLVISGIALWLAFRGVEWSLVVDALRSTHVQWLFAGSAALVAGIWITALRWKLLLQAGRAVRTADAFAYLCIGYMANSLLPMRLGDIARATLLARQKGLSLSRVFGSLAVDRVIDLLTLMCFAGLLAVAMELPRVIQTALVTMVAVSVAAFGAIAAAAAGRAVIVKFARFICDRLPPAFAARAVTAVDHFVEALATLRNPRLLGITLLCSIAAWSLTGLAMWWWGRAFHLSIPWYAGFFTMVAVNIGSAIPSSPGYIGVYHYLCVLALSVWVRDQPLMLGYAIGTHAVNMVLNVSLGMYYLWRNGLSMAALTARMPGNMFRSNQAD